MAEHVDPLIERFLRVHLPAIQRRFALREAWIYGSRPRGDALDDSDLDVLLVSDAFEGVFFTERSARVLIACRVDDPVSFLCYSPEEFAEKREELGIVGEAVREGMRVA